MLKLVTHLTTVLLALLLALPTIGCQPKPVVDGEPRDQQKAPKAEKGLNIEVDAGKTKVRVESDKKPGEKGRHLDVDVEHHPSHEHESGDGNK